MTDSGTNTTSFGSTVGANVGAATIRTDVNLNATSTAILVRGNASVTTTVGQDPTAPGIPAGTGVFGLEWVAGGTVSSNNGTVQDLNGARRSVSGGAGPVSVALNAPPDSLNVSGASATFGVGGGGCQIFWNI